MSNEPGPADPGAYAGKLTAWALMAGAVVAAAVLSALVQKWLGVRVDLPPPPVVVVQPAGAPEPSVTVVRPQVRP